MNTFAIVDLETTGNAASKGDRIIEIGIVLMDEKRNIIREFSSLIYPEREIPPFISSLTGIQEDDLLDAPLFSEVADEIYSILKSTYFVAHNIEFDLGFLNEEFKRCGYKPLHNPVLDTVELARIMLPMAPSFKLGQLSDWLEMGHDQPHRALSDAKVTGDLLAYLLERLQNLPEKTLVHFLKIESKLKSELRPLILNVIDEKRYGKASEIEYDLLYGIPIKKVDRSHRGGKSKLLPFNDWIEKAYEQPEGLKKLLPSYETRKGQKEMSQSVHRAFSSSTHALIEAGAGTGKSIAYLLAAVHHSMSNNARVLISTHTTSLQKQLLEKEIPLLAKMTDREIKAVLYKGRSHYISLVHFSYELEQSHHDNYDIALTKAMLLVWLLETSTGDIDEIQLPSNGKQFWYKVSSEQSTKKVELDIGKDSFFHWAQQRADQADVIITNHALLCMDIISSEQRLPFYDYVIIDEAHHLDAVASRYFGVRLNYKELQRQLTQFSEIFKKRVYKHLKITESIYSELDKCQFIVDEAKEELNHFSRFIFQRVKQQKKREKAKSDVGRIQYLLNEDKDYGFYSIANEMCQRFLAALRKLIAGMEKIRDYLYASEQLNENQSIAILRSRLDTQIHYCNEVREQLIGYFDFNNTNEVKWIEIEGEGATNAVYLFKEPLNVAELLNERLFSEKESVVLTSATMTTSGSFNYMRKTLGLADFKNIDEVSYPSPYEYEKQVKLMVPNDFPNVKSQPEEFIEAISEAIYSTAVVTKGRMLVLFTSYEMLKKTYTLLKEFVDPEEFMVFAQGVSSGSRDRLKKNFQAFEQSILLGTSSFWEGVDIPGDDLSCLMIVRLPFQPPHQPVQSMKDRKLRDGGYNPFMERSLPHAIIRFKQGFGRLIRSSTDRGVVFVCDQRLMEAKYGKYFLSSIPDVPVTFSPTRELIDEIDKWL
ncbi:ATP-dependent DNA helicase DinG [Halobacillus sp. BBL2006]|uniref:ATP-dependent DNA helicase DinG n=1 Tax=Halobacillus sp. BBL2006 TaxID=1543706 RepID=UPI0005432A4C|nr:ATP-dependent DNA helicase DinG [Halobacillus sp. BBL2006]KHE72389.1 ATP-dependent DNA helicase DinG [Halobacillus sp. BBL2006]